MLNMRSQRYINTGSIRISALKMKNEHELLTAWTPLFSVETMNSFSYSWPSQKSKKATDSAHALLHIRESRLNLVPVTV